MELGIVELSSYAVQALSTVITSSRAMRHIMYGDLCAMPVKWGVIDVTTDAELLGGHPEGERHYELMWPQGQMSEIYLVKASPDGSDIAAHNIVAVYVWQGVPNDSDLMYAAYMWDLRNVTAPDLTDILRQADLKLV